MPIPAEFEEKEYEGALFRELVTGGDPPWTPGQVFEHHFGVDAAVLLRDPHIWARLGYAQALDGVILPDFSFGYLWRRLGHRRTLPNVALNMFLQTKRPEKCRRRPAGVSPAALGLPYFRFSTTAHQQLALERLARTLRARAYVGYACPAFLRLPDLFDHVSTSSIVGHSTFIRASRLRGHRRWNYSAPGTRGVANPQSEEVADPSLAEQLAALGNADASTGEETAAASLTALGDAVLETTSALSDADDPLTRSRATILLTAMEPLTQVLPSTPDLPLAPFAVTTVFCHAFGFLWAVVER